MKNNNLVYYAIMVLAILTLASLALSLKTASSVNYLQEELGQVSQSIEELSNTIGELNSNMEKISSAVTDYSSRFNQFQNAFSTTINSLVKEIQESKFPLEIQDAMNRLVVITRQPEKIVSIAPSITEILFSINAGDLVVGVDDYSNYPPIVNQLVQEGKIEKVGGFADISIEKVLLLNPDIVIGTTGVQYKVLYKLSQTGLTTLSLKTESISDIFADILIIGKITGHTEDAINLVEELKNNITSLYLRITQETNTTPTIAYIVWIDPIYAAGGTCWFNDIIELSGGVNALGNITQEWPAISWEQIIEANPDIILVSEYAGGFTNASQVINWLEQQPGGQELTAVKTNNVYMLHGELNDIASRPGPRIHILQEALSLIMHPEIYNQTSIPNDLTIEYVYNATETMS